ncbi:MAG: hypothetical protein LBS32_09035 [Clostridiales Family XIII bacterium]|jgi:hypothetical protein|nr:hypothetical protein [Clostridiales Family XIII bacterium]
MALQDAGIAICVGVFLVVLLAISFIGYNKNYKGKPQEKVVIPPDPDAKE